jgi:predicted CXXCH cytochrome family protein
LFADQTTLCLNCHSKAIKTPARTIAGMKQLLQKSKYLHGAIDSTGCSACHNPHFADHDNLLVGKYKNDFYLSAVKDSVALCFNCHKPELLTAQSTTAATTFRDGNKNLHFVHVNGKKGRNCGVCHNVHASNQKHLLNEKIPFGNWTMTMTYTEKPNGGSCLTACHAEKSYQR